MPPLPQLADPQRYRPCTWDLRDDPQSRAYWMELFRSHADRLVRLITDEYPDATEPCKMAFREDYLRRLDRFEGGLADVDKPNIIGLTEIRRDALAQAGFPDPYRAIKQRENARALELLPDLLREIEATTPTARLDLLIAGLMAGNIFDLGAPETIQRYEDGQTGFAQTRATQPARPWAIDDLDRWRKRLQDKPPYRHVLFFVDNAGSDIVLGCLPLARCLVATGARVTLAANSGAALNDITANELVALLPAVAQMDDLLREACEQERLRVAATGNSLPLIDLSALSDECVCAAADVDLVILHGMGRAIESNFDAGLKIDSLRTAVIKDRDVARHLGMRVFDCVFRYDRL